MEHGLSFEFTLGAGDFENVGEKHIPVFRHKDLSQGPALKFFFLRLEHHHSLAVGKYYAVKGVHYKDSAINYFQDVSDQFGLRCFKFI